MGTFLLLQYMHQCMPVPVLCHPLQYRPHNPQLVGILVYEVADIQVHPIRPEGVLPQL